MVAETQCIESDAVDDAQDSGKRTLNHKLSSSSLSMSLPPDSPPEIFDYPHGLLHAPDSSRTGTTAIPWTQISSRVKPRPSEHSSPCSRRRLSRAGQPSVASSTSCLDSATGIVPDLTRFDASTELDDDTQSKFSALRSAAPAGSAASTPGTLTYNPLTKDEVERLFASADTLIRTKDQELTLFSTAGEGLRQEYHTVRGRHSSLLKSSLGVNQTTDSPKRHSAKSVFEEPSTSSPSLRSTALAFNDTPMASPRMSSESLSAYGDLPDFNYASSSSAHPATPLRLSSTSARRHFQGTLASASSSSIFGVASSRAGLESSPVPLHELEALSQANYSLTVKLSDLEAESERTEQAGKRRLRKLQRELAALKQELERVEARNTDLEAATVASGPVASPWRTREDLAMPPPAFPRRQRRSSSPTRGVEEGVMAPVATDFTPSRGLGSTAPSTPLPVSFERFRRSPGNGTPQASGREVQVKVEATLDAPVAEKASLPPISTQTLQPELVAQLLSKIEELQDAKSTIEEERSELDSKLQRATKEMDAFKQRCEELEELSAVGWDDRRGAIEWPSNDHKHSATPNSDLDLSPTKSIRGNRRAIQRHQSRKASISMSASRQSLSSVASWRSGSPAPRTLGSELGSHWADSSFERDLNAKANGESGAEDHEEAVTLPEGDDRTESTLGASSTSTPTRHKLGATGLRHDILLTSDNEDSEGPEHISPTQSRATKRVIADFELDTTADLIPRGALRYAGAPDSETYEQLTRAASELPAVWESEEDLDPEMGRGRGLHSGKVADSVLRRLEWREPYEGEAQHEDYWAKYPEEEDGDGTGEQMLRLESNDMVAERERHRLRRRMRRRRRRQRAKAQTCEEDSPLTRRRQALARLGLQDPHDYVSDESDDRYRKRVGGSDFTGSRRSEYGEEDESSGSDGSHSTRSGYTGSYSSADMSDFSYLSHNPLDARRYVARTDNTFYPLTRRARYAPRMLAHRFTDVAMQHLFTLVTYVRFFAVLGLAIAYALWQGPKKTMGVQARRRIS